jgi:hypothetical protein
MPRGGRQRPVLRSAAAAITAATATVEAAEAASAITETASTPTSSITEAAATQRAAFAASEVAAAPPLGVAHQRHAEPGVLTPPPRPAADADGLRQFGRDRRDARREAIR